MSFDPIQPDQMNNQNILTTSVRIVTGDSKVNAPTFGQKFMSGLKMFGSMFGRIGGGLLSVFPFFPGSQIASAGLYGLGNLAQQSYQDGIQKRMNNLSMDEAAAQSNFTAITPGFDMGGGPSIGGRQSISPTPNQEMAWGTVLNREAAASDQISKL